MDFMTLLGVACGLGVVWHILAAGNMTHFLLNKEAMILIFGGTLGSVLVSYPWSAIKRIPIALRMMFFPPRRPDALTLIDHFTRLAEKAHREGVDALSEELPRLPHPYMVDCLHMLLDGLEPDVIRERCERDMLAAQQRHMQVTAVFTSAGTYAPIFGLLGTLIGVVQVLRNITDPQAMGSSMAVAMTASFYGIFSANFFFLPVAAKLAHYSEEDFLARELITKGVLCLQQNETPWLISRKLEAYLSFHLRRRGVSPVKAVA